MKEKYILSISRIIILIKINLTTFIRYFRLFSKRCPKCNTFKVNNKKHTSDDCILPMLLKLKKDLGVK